MDDMRIENKKYIENSNECCDVINGLTEIQEFLDHYSFLTYGRDNIFIKNYFFSLQSIIMSSELTIGSIIECCRASCIADANTLLRKYRDDLFFYLYIIVLIANKKIDVVKNTKEMEVNIEKWLQNGLNNLNINHVLKAIGRSPYVFEATEKYNLEKSFSAISKRLNNYVHGNGFKFYNKNFSAYEKGTLLSCLKEILIDAKYITVTFLFLLVLCAPSYITSMDYIDYLECGKTPPEGSQYWVDDFVKRFLQDNIQLIDESGFNYLKDNTFIDFE